jgi:glycosyltransferase involved in cell wall biosynthesis
MTRKKIMFLYAELTHYLLGCIDEYSKLNKSNLIKVIYLNKFHNLSLKHNNSYEFISNEKFKTKRELLSYCENFNPNILIISGRMSKDYLYVAKKLKNTSIRVTVQDTLYKRSMKQFLIKIFKEVLYKRYFDKFWGVGSLQTKFALDIGFDKKDIKEGFYVADKKFLNNSSIVDFKNKFLNILFIGRLVKEKNIIKLAEAIDSINNSSNSKHKLIVIGEGYLKNEIQNYECVEYEGSKSQDDIIEIALKCDVFCLPSIYEPWGVVTHEMCSLGLPILISNMCGSSEDLVINKHNGFKFNPFDISSIKKAILNFSNLDRDTKLKFSKNSIELSKKINHELWSNNLNSFLSI